jgi:hypothetical protein
MPVFAKQWLCKQRPLLGNIRNIHTSNNRTSWLCNQFLSNRSVNTSTTIRVWLETLFSILSVLSSYKEEFSWESAVEFRSSKWAVQLSEVTWSSWLVRERVQLPVECQPMRRRLRGWCEMASSLGSSQLSRRLTGVLHGRLWQEDLSSGSWRISTTVARKRLVETVIDWGHWSVWVSDL